jgi:hypothetical protein
MEMQIEWVQVIPNSGSMQKQMWVVVVVMMVVCVGSACSTWRSRTI